MPNPLLPQEVLNRSFEVARLFQEARDGKRAIFSPKELWIQKALKNEFTFSEEEFKECNQELKAKIYYLANVCCNEKIVEKLNRLGMKEDPIYAFGTDIFAYNMDIVSTKHVMGNFLRDLKNKGVLITAEKFSHLDKSNYISKGNQLGRIQGKNLVEYHIQQNNLTEIKVPQKKVVIEDKNETILLRLDRDLEIVSKEDQLTIYAERVPEGWTQKRMSLKRALELMILIEKTGLNDIFRNFIISEDAIYLIDTEYTNYDPLHPNFPVIELIKNFLDAKEIPFFEKVFKKRKHDFDKEAEKREQHIKEYKKAYENEFRILTTGYADHFFSFEQPLPF